MKKLCFLALVALSGVIPSLSAEMNIAIVNFKMCVDQSKLGKEEQSNFEALRNQMEKSFEAKEKDLTEMSNKFNDADFLDSLSLEAETELKRKFRVASQELNQLQSQYYQALSQANMKIIQQMQDAVVIASKAVAEEKNIDLIVNDESTFFYNPKHDISMDVIAMLDKNYEQEAQNKKEIKHGEK